MRCSAADKEIYMGMQVCSTLVVALILSWSPLQAAAFQSNTSQGHNTSQPEKAKKCEENAKKMGLKGDDRAAFLSSCMAAKDTAAATMSPEEKAKVNNADSCEQQATQKGLKGKDRKTFMKTCSAGE